MTRTDEKLDQVELSATIAQPDDQPHEAQPSWASTLAGEEDPFFDVDPSLVIGGPSAYPPQPAQNRRSIKPDHR